MPYKRVKILVSILILNLLSQSVLSQQDALYSQYMFNQFTINPAYAGTRNSMSGVLLYRSQWVGMSDAPKTVNLSIHSPFRGKKMALGFNLITDELGPTRSDAIMGTYAYHLRTTKGRISFGLRGGFISSTLNNNLLDFYLSDNHEDSRKYTSMTPNFDFGMYYYTSNYYAGLSINHLADNHINFQLDTLINDKHPITKIDLSRNIVLATGGVYEINNNLMFRPSFMLKYVENMMVNYDLNASFLFNKTLWIGATYRSSKNLVFITEYNISDVFRMGYSFDFDLSKIRVQTSGSHEIFLGFDLNPRKDKSVSTRYM